MTELDRIQDRFTTWCRTELFTDEVIRAVRLTNRICDLLLVRLYRSLGMQAHLAEPHTAAELVSLLGLGPPAEVAVDAMLGRLQDRMAVVSSTGGDGTRRFRAAGEAADPTEELSRLRKEVAQLPAAYSAGIEFLDFGADHFVRALKDEPDFFDRVLSGRVRELFELWHRATNTDPLQDLHGKMAARAVFECFERGTILEVGGGTGNGTRHLFAMLSGAKALGRIERYIFTDISLSFLVSTRKELVATYPSVSADWRVLDVNKHFAVQKIKQESVNLIYGVNAAHVAKDIIGFLKECRESLTPGGAVLFAERVRQHPREMAAREISLNLSSYHRIAEQKDLSLRPMHAYLTPDNWVSALQKAGFRDAVILPEMQSLAGDFPDQYAAVIYGRK